MSLRAIGPPALSQSRPATKLVYFGPQTCVLRAKAAVFETKRIHVAPEVINHVVQFSELIVVFLGALPFISFQVP